MRNMPNPTSKQHGAVLLEYALGTAILLGAFMAAGVSLQLALNQRFLISNLLSSRSTPCIRNSELSKDGDSTAFATEFTGTDCE